MEPTWLDYAVLWGSVTLIGWLFATGALSSRAMGVEPRFTAYLSWLDMGVGLLLLGAGQMTGMSFNLLMFWVLFRVTSMGWHGEAVFLWDFSRLKGVMGTMAAIAAASIFLALGTSILTGMLHWMVMQTPVEPVAHKTLRDLIDGSVQTQVILALIAVVVAPLLEEFVFRGYLQTAMLGAMRNRWLAIVGTSLVFAVVHVGSAAWYALPTLFVLSLGMGYAYERCRSIWAPVVVHAAFNVVQILLTLAMHGGR